MVIHIQENNEDKIMNNYSVRFYVKCPSDGEIIQYNLLIFTDDVILVEHINTTLALIKTGYHEHIADNLYKRFRGCQILKATHQDVDITTTRGFN